MQTEPTNFQLMTNSGRPVVRRPEHTRPSARAMSLSAAADALDAAFDEYKRIDVGTQRPTASHDSRAMTKDLIADISGQLSVLDRQREQLASLLRGGTV